MKVDVTVIGSGVTGLTVAHVLSRDLSVCVIEKEDRLGGLAWQLGCKATDVCLYCGVCHALNMKAAGRSPLAESFPVRLNENIVSVHRVNDRLLLATSRQEEIETRCVVLATGVRPYPAEKTSNLGYRKYPAVFTGFDIEQGLNEGILDIFASYRYVAFIQCVGSRSFKEKRGYCSRVCCRYALRIAENLKYRYPDLTIDFFYMDLQLLGGKKEKLEEIARSRVRLCRFIPFRTEEQGGKLALMFENETKVVRELYDAVILSVGMIPSTDTLELGRLFQINFRSDGFIRNYGQGKSSRNNVYVAGTAWGPNDIEGSIRDARRVAETVVREVKTGG
ncbi:MAG TPA: FAD-dependent oxidoreductase [Atribacteraceae bacterium]|nr:FAD-dependent oxidoreductase [Atribacteraceae bacterium]